MNFDDPRITAHALGELDSAEDLAAVERLLQESPEARAEYEELKTFTANLRRELKGEPDAGLTAHQRSEVLATAKTGPGLNGNVVLFADAAPKRKSPWYRQTWMPVGIAAVALFTTAIAVLWDRSQFEERHVRQAQLPRSIQQTTEATPSSEAPPAPTLAGRTSELALGIELPTETAPAPSAEAQLKEESRGRSVDAMTARDASPSRRVQLITSTPKDESADQVLRIAPSDVTRQKLSLTPAESTLKPDPANNRYMDADPSKLPEVLFGNEALSKGIPGPVSAPAPAPTSGAASGGERTILRDEQDFLTVGDKAKKGVAGDSKRLNVPAMPAQKSEQLEQVLAEAAGAQPMRSREGVTRSAVPAKPASASVSRKTGISDSENEFLGWDYSMRNFRKEAEENSGYALVVPTPVPGLTPPVVPDPEPFYTRLAPAPEQNTEAYDAIQDNRFLNVTDSPLSTFSIDVDTASYSNVRRFLTGGALPPKGAVRIEELVNYFTYDYPQPQGADPFSSTLEVATCPWEPKHRLVRIGLKGRELPKEQRPPSNLVFLIDVSGSMRPQNKLPLVKESLQQMIAELGPKDTVAIAVYAGASGTVLEPTSDRDAIRAALSRLEAGGSTNGASGIQLAYDLAKRSFNKEGNNRVVLATDGDFNVGVTNRSELVDLIEKRAKEGVFLTVLGFGMGNLKDATLEQLADKGNGNYAYIDSIREGRKVLVEEMAGTLFTIAKDVKIQVEFNPAQVSAYRLIGYENRLLAKEDFNDDKKDAGEIGAGHTVTALYQIVPAGVAIENPGVDPLKYQPKPETAPAPAREAPAAGASKEMLTLKLRFKQPDGDTSTLREFPLTDGGLTWERSSRDFRFAAAVASFGMLLRDSPHKGSSNWDSTMELAVEGKGEDAGGYRQEFIGLVAKAKSLQPGPSAK